MVAESFAWFLDLVKQRRTLTESAVADIEAGGIYTGRQAKEIALIDDLGGEDEAVAWLEAEREIAADRKIIDYGVTENGPLDALADIFGFARVDRSILSPGLFAIYR
jgi:protease-4